MEGINKKIKTPKEVSSAEALNTMVKAYGSRCDKMKKEEIKKSQKPTAQNSMIKPCGKTEFKKNGISVICGFVSFEDEVLLCENCKNGGDEQDKDLSPCLIKRKRDKIYSRQYREKIRNKERVRVYKIDPNTKKFKKNLERVRRIEEKIEKIKKVSKNE